MQGLANTAWAFATVSQQDAQLFAALARVAELRLGDFKVQDLANTAWAFATAGQPDAQLFMVLARVPPFSVAWATFTPAAPPPAKIAHPSQVGHIFQLFFKIGFSRILGPTWEAFGFQIWNF